MKRFRPTPAGLPYEGKLVLFLIALVLFFTALEASFASSSSASSILGRAATDGLVAVAMMPVLVQRELDLSVGSILALGSLTAITMVDYGLPVAVLAALLTGCVAGLFNGVVITKWRINSFIATLATALVFRGIAFLGWGSQPISGSDPMISVQMSQPVLGLLTPRMLILIAAVVMCQYFLRTTPIGRRMYAVGGNPAAAEAVGIRRSRSLVLAFMISGAGAATAGAFLGIELNLGSPTLGTQTVLAAIAAAVVGGVSLSGGRGEAYGALLGVIIIATVGSGIFLVGVPPEYDQTITGAILIAAVLLDRLRGGSSTLRWSLRRHLSKPTETEAPA